MTQIFDRIFLVPIGLAVISTAALLPETALAQDSALVVIASSSGQPAVTPDAKFLGTVPLQVSAASPPKQVLLAWKFAHERMIAMDVPVFAIVPIAAPSPRIPFQPTTGFSSGLPPSNPTYQPDLTNEPMVDTLRQPVAMPSN